MCSSPCPLLQHCCPSQLWGLGSASQLQLGQEGRGCPADATCPLAFLATSGVLAAADNIVVQSVTGMDLYSINQTLMSMPPLGQLVEALNTTTLRNSTGLVSNNTLSLLSLVGNLNGTLLTGEGGWAGRPSLWPVQGPCSAGASWTAAACQARCPV